MSPGQKLLKGYQWATAKIQVNRAEDYMGSGGEGGTLLRVSRPPYWEVYVSSVWRRRLLYIKQATKRFVLT